MRARFRPRSVHRPNWFRESSPVERPRYTARSKARKTRSKRGLSESCSVDVALEQYDQQRIAATMADYRENIGRAHLGPAPPELLAMRARLRSDVEAARQFYLAQEGMIAAPAAGDSVSR